MNPRPRIAVFGSVHMDLIAHADQLPAQAASGLAHAFTMGLGGKGGNQAAECAKAGAETFMVTRLGDDGFGRDLISSLQSHGVNCMAITVAAGQQTGASTVLSSPQGYTSLIYPGVAAAMTPHEVEARVASLPPFDALLVQLELPLQLSTAAAKVAKANGARVVLNAAPPRSVDKALQELLSLSDIVVVNEIEARALAGSADSVAVAKSANAIAVVTLGKNGCTASDGHSCWHEAAQPVAVKSTVGAGDAFLAGFCVSLCESGDIPAALRNGACAAARNLSS
jgi:ribokinase